MKLPHISMQHLPLWLTSGRGPIWYRYVLYGHLTGATWKHYLTVFGKEFSWDIEVRE